KPVATQKANPNNGSDSQNSKPNERGNIGHLAFNINHLQFTINSSFRLNNDNYRKLEKLALK
ncbi:MAG: hypothetical protein AAFR89_06390, partial [Cyanobacteria bacterium J06633_1]